MTVSEYLTSATDLDDIAKKVGVHISQIYRWRAGDTLPGGAELARLIQISDHAITPEDIATPLQIKSARKKKSA